ncbi:PilN domain-containing protein [Nitrospirillum sp. BR 11163]|uniref:PilN domain-containing protein n=1 Tax=Nitrospirillum sp. BR 11163 TaxID=3104323 RepID=UPI002AFDD363|nr:PilN domain-containing protein [Nitrospirillum sp. BR 11163]MEA1674774.1 PilN domain-containing protein [Nitrospirillum sp. BR 11163]
MPTLPHRLKRLAVLAMDGLADGVIAALPRRWRRPLGLEVPVLFVPPGGVGLRVPADRGPVRLMPVRLVLDPVDVHTVDVPLPKGGLGGAIVDARGFVEMQAHRFMPLRPDLLAWDVVTLPFTDGGLRKGGGMARVYMVRRTVLSAVLASAVGAGLTLAGVTAAVPAGPAPEFLRFNPVRVRRRALGMLLVAGLFWLALPIPFAVAIWILDQQTANVERKLAGVAKEARAVQDMRDRMLFLSPDATATAVLLAQPGRGQVLDELALALPDGVWLKDVTLAPRGVTLQGRAADLADVLARVRAAGPFTDPHFTDPPDAAAAPVPSQSGGAVRDFTLATSLAVGSP